ncbi:hypothetical protein [Saccharibacillus kuerlensis]|uniref:Uncharacterized protein n=1 Tax=Saccharibacillus kuerlensis TaxID=459527 RepID=A0ABQ2KTE4_9BACL|nr:hypothetical protein [Saccharibacillus kuerlensis]GGN91046.1 hypothetical protein GCM10010969_02200 [Saccharibacillus kuerlensis]
MSEEKEKRFLQEKTMDQNESRKTKEGRRGRGEGAQTFRRGRALHFLERLELRRSTLTSQLKEESLASIHPVIAGELKAVDSIIQEFVQVFELYEKSESDEQRNNEHCDSVHRRKR